MGKVFEWARLDRRGDVDEGYRWPTLRTRRGDRFTRWDWVKWWRGRGRVDVVRCPAWIVAPTECSGTLDMAVRQALNARSARFCPPTRS